MWFTELRTTVCRYAAVMLVVVAIMATDRENAMAEDSTAAHIAYAALYSPGPAWQLGKPMEEQGLRNHGLYIRSLRDAGTLIAGGKLGETRGLAVFKTASLEDAEALLAADPAITGGIFVAELVPWTIAFANEGFPVTPLYR